jgi:ribosomal protein S18 acetylase RimI-like enzyme
MSAPRSVAVVREARSDDAAAIARVHVDSWRTTYRGIVADDVLSGLSYERRERNWVQWLSTPEVTVYVAEEESGIVGFASGGPGQDGDPDYAAELYAIYLLQAHQGKGLGRRLFVSVAERLAQAGTHSMLLWVLAANHQARRFYEGLGGVKVRERQYDIGGTMYGEVAYGWTSTAALRS